MRIAFVYSPGRKARLTGLAAGEVPSDFYYGAVELAAGGHTVEHFEFDNTAVPALVPGAIDLLRKARVLPPKVDGWTLMNAWMLSAQLNAYDVVVATVGHHGLALALCRKLGRLRRPLVSIQCGLLNQPCSSLQRAFTRELLLQARSIFFGPAEVEPVRQAFGLPEGRLYPGQFGIDLRFWTPDQQPRETYVLAIGNDAQRDYGVLVEAARRIQAPVRIVTRLALPEPLPANVSLIRGSWHAEAFTDQELRELYRRAACVVTPLRESLQPSGQSVTLQAMACGAPVVLTRTGGLWNPDGLRDGENVSLVAPGDADAMAAAVGRLAGNAREASRLGSAGLASAHRDGDMKTFARQIADLCGLG